MKVRLYKNEKGSENSNPKYHFIIEPETTEEELAIEALSKCKYDKDITVDVMGFGMFVPLSMTRE